MKQRASEIGMKRLQLSVERPNDRKTNVYFLAEYHDQEFIAQKSEVSKIVLLDYHEALKVLQYEESKRELMEAEDYLGKK